MPTSPTAHPSDRGAGSNQSVANSERADDAALVHDESSPYIQGSVSVATDNTLEITLPSFDGTFSSWADLETAFERYQTKTHQIYKLRTSNSIRDRNRDRTKRAALSGQKPVLFDEKLVFYSKTFICTHGWQFNPRGKGTRTNHTVRSIGCNARLNALLSQAEDGSYTVRVTKHCSAHIHNVGSSVYYTYAENRKIESNDIEKVAKTLWQGGANRKTILRYLKEASGKPIQPKDVENMIAQMRRDTYTSADDDVRVSQLLEDFGEDPGNAVSISRDPATELTRCIVFQTAHMKSMARKFPEVLCIDATHDTNIDRYRLFSFMVTDKFGSGAFVQHALIDGETSVNMKSAFRALKQNNPAWTEVNVVILDKDFTEIGVSAEELPDVTVILCHFHVIDYIKREISKRVYGFTPVEKMHAKNWITMMVRTADERGFERLLQALRVMCKDKPDFYKYLETNWLTCKELWCKFLRGNIPHLDNNTNNRLEASWGAAKDILDRHIPMDECIDHLLFLQQIAEDKYRFKTKRVGIRHNRQYDEEMQILAKIATHHACDLVGRQYTVSKEADYTVESDENSPSCFTLTSQLSPSQYAVNLEFNNCSCMFSQTLLLPCRHIMFLRREDRSFRSAIPFNAIPERWSIADDCGEDNNEASDTDVAPSLVVADVKPDGAKQVLSHNEKYRTIFAVCQRIAEVVADKGKRRFTKWNDYMLDLERMARADKDPPSMVTTVAVPKCIAGPGIEGLSDVGAVGNVGEEITNTSDIGEADVGEETTNSGDVGEETTNSGDGGEADVGTANSGDVGESITVVGEIGEGITIRQKVDNPVSSDIMRSTKTSGQLSVPEPNSTKTTPKKTSGHLAKRKLERDDTTQTMATQKVMKIQSKKLVTLNPGSRPSGRPKQKESFKKAKRKKEIEDTRAFVNTVVNIGDATLEIFDEVVKTKQLSIAVVGDTMDGIRRMFEGAAFKRPKAFVVKGECTRAVETNVRFVLPDSATNVKIREKLISDTLVSSNEIIISILSVGTFSLVDIERMKPWYEVSKKTAKARKLMKFVEMIAIEDDHESEGRQQILRTIPFMNVDGVFRAGGHDISFMELAGYGGEQWLNDSCVYVASLRVTKEAMKLTWRQPMYITVLDPVYMQMTDVKRRDRYLDTEDNVFTKMRSNRIVCCPTYIDVEFPHWCGIIFDMERRIVWKYDPFHKKSFLDEVETIITNVYKEIENATIEMEIRTFPVWLQQDGFSCGVLVVQWFELYLSVARTTAPDASVPMAHGDKLGPKELSYERYKHFSYVFDSIVTNVDNEQ